MINLNPTLAIRVRDLGASLQFYRDKMGYAVTGNLVQLPSGEALLLVEEAAGDAETQFLQPGDSIYLWSSGLVALHDRLVEHGAIEMQFKPNPAWITLSIPDPDGYRLDFMEEPALADAEILALYESGPARLQEALAGLTEADLDLVRAPGKWSIRQIVHHLVDSSLPPSVAVKFALAEPGRPYNGNGYSGDALAAGLDYAHRPIGPEVALFGALIAHIAGLCHHLPEALDRRVVINGEPRIVRRTLQQSAGHLFHHLEQIAETRQFHNR